MGRRLAAFKRGFHVVKKVVTRTKPDDQEESKLARVLGIFDLTFLGVGSTLGVGVYVLAGEVAYNTAGPAVVISFMIAALASVMAALCYAEFAARVPKAGSAYIYSYVTVGELAAFIIGWNLILEYVIGTASVARAFSAYIDQMAQHAMSQELNRTMHIPVKHLSPYPDFLSLGIVLLLTALLAYGVRASALMNNIFTAVNLLTITLVVVAGLTKVNFKNWALTKSEVTKGTGGFMPFGMSGVMAGAAKCFFGFVGFDSIATTGEEAKKPQRSIPIAIMISLLIVFFAYFSISAVITLMVPYDQQDPNAPLVHVFKKTNMSVIGHIVSVGAIFALCTSLLGAMFPLPRVIYSMARDGILFTFLSKIHPITKTALLTTILSGIFIGIMAMMFELSQLVDMMSIGTLLAYTVVSLCVLILRYRTPHVPTEPAVVTDPTEKPNHTQLLFNTRRIKRPDHVTMVYSESLIGAFVILCLITTLLMVVFEKYFLSGYWTIWVALGFLLCLIVFTVILLALHPKDSPPIFFKVPLLPFIPCLSIFVNIYLMMKLDVYTWIRFAVWLAIGAIIYFAYTLTHSVEGKRQRELEKANQEK